MTVNKYILLIIACAMFARSHLSHADTINVAVAANFKQTLQALKTPFEKTTPHRIKIISASTGQLLQQISQHAPFDIFLAANTAHPQLLWQHIHESRDLGLDALAVYAKGRLVFFSRTPLSEAVSLEQALTNKMFTRISMANPKLAPYGLAAQQSIECLTSDTYWREKSVIGQNVAQAFQFIDSNNVDGGFVALSQVLNKDPGNISVIDEACYDDINQMALRLNNQPASLAFMTFLQSTAAQHIIRQNGYHLP
ncbi:MAG: molybdate ABC transporter substrate-binding protein [Bermanella sp.]|nr:molybdate ABC transporter substrate-binding protein [Bermanella sp.]